MPVAMIDLDNTLLDFSQMFLNFIKEKYGYDLNKDDIITYDMQSLFEKANIDESTKVKMFNAAFLDDEFYAKAIPTENYDLIFKIADFLKTELGYTLEIHTKVSTPTMETAKKEYFKFHQDYKRFKKIIVENTGSLNVTSIKPVHYDLIIDDSPHVVEHYLDNSTTGKVILPVTLYNEYLLSIDKYENRIFPIKDGKELKPLFKKKDK